MSAGARRARDFQDRARLTLHAYTCPARNFECDLLLPSDAYMCAGGAQLHGLGERCYSLGVGRDCLAQFAGPDFGVLGRGCGLYAAAHKFTLLETNIAWCGKVYSQGEVKYDFQRLAGLATMKRPETAVDLMQFLRAVDWLRTSLPRMAQVVWPLRVFLEEHLAGTERRTKRVASKRAISAGEWTSELIGAWDDAQDLVAHAVALSHTKPGWTVLMFPDASDEHWASFLTQVHQEELDRGVPVEDLTHEPLGFLSGIFRGSQQRWATADKEGFAMVSTFRRLEYVLWIGVHIYTDQRNWRTFSTRRLACRPL